MRPRSCKEKRKAILNYKSKSSVDASTDDSKHNLARYCSWYSSTGRTLPYMDCRHHHKYTTDTIDMTLMSTCCTHTQQYMSSAYMPC